uniref:Orange domain-containing protein n=1 Tax=Salmo trutta TaxID=8032 RepID=A0A674DVS4_SALTR
TDLYSTDLQPWHLQGKLTNKLRKPVVEKLRRDRINNSIEQLKSLLVPEILNQGYSRCVQYIVHFLSKDELKTQSQRRLLRHFQSLQPSSDKNRIESDCPQLSSPAQHSISKDKSPVNITLWRPW